MCLKPPWSYFLTFSLEQWRCSCIVPGARPFPMKCLHFSCEWLPCILLQGTMTESQRRGRFHGRNVCPQDSQREWRSSSWGLCPCLADSCLLAVSSHGLSSVHTHPWYLVLEECQSWQLPSVLMTSTKSLSLEIVTLGAVTSAWECNWDGGVAPCHPQQGIQKCLCAMLLHIPLLYLLWFHPSQESCYIKLWV